MRKRWKIVLAALVVTAAGSGVLWYARHAAAAPPPFRTAPVRRGDLLVTIAATGTLEPEEVVDVGAQVAGQINAFGRDENGRLIDYGSVVEEGTVLAEIDDSLYAADVALAAAQLDQAKAGERRADADLMQFNARFYQAERDWNRAQKLTPADAMTQTDYDSYQSAYESAKANVAVGEAAIGQAHSAVAQAEATLKRARRNLGYCTIKAPVKGVIIDRRVNIGQTVVASLNAPSLFLIAKDLNRMQVWVSVNEADIGSIHPGQAVTFTVDAYPGETFRGEVNKIRLNAAMTQNVVTYTVEVSTDNSSGKLLPYLTANTQFEVQKVSDVLLVPNAALRWTPQADQLGAGARDSAVRALDRTRGTAEPAAAAHRPGTLFVADGSHVRPLEVLVGASDGTMSEVQGSAVAEGTAVVIGELHGEASAPAAGASPFTPQMGRARASQQAQRPQ